MFSLILQLESIHVESQSARKRRTWRLRIRVCILKEVLLLSFFMFQVFEISLSSQVFEISLSSHGTKRVRIKRRGGKKEVVGN